MNTNQKSELARAIAWMLCSHAAHGLSTASIKGVGEITLRDGLIVAAAAIGSKHKNAWLLEREVEPDGWSDSNVDLMVYRVSGENKSLVGGTELKWWRQKDKGNASNRRRDLIKDLLRAAALYTLSESFSFVALLATKESWDATTDTRGKDKALLDKLKSESSEHWNIRDLSSSPSIKAAVRLLRNKVPVTTAFRTKLLNACSLSDQSGIECVARVWEVQKTQNSRWAVDPDDFNFIQDSV
ncbi:hypothetical protein I5U29_02350 [Stenotrophomonas maltophilia]|nr:hypothetical protein [Stenotrophomonas maltophilia]